MAVIEHEFCFSMQPLVYFTLFVVMKVGAYDENFPTHRIAFSPKRVWVVISA